MVPQRERDAETACYGKGYLDLRVEVEEGVEAHLELGFNFFTIALKDMHGDVSFVAIFERDGSVAYLDDLISG